MHIILPVTTGANPEGGGAGNQNPLPTNFIKMKKLSHMIILTNAQCFSTYRLFTPAKTIFICVRSVYNHFFSLFPLLYITILGFGSLLLLCTWPYLRHFLK